MPPKCNQQDLNARLKQIETKIESLSEIVDETRTWQLSRQGEISGAKEERNKYIEVAKFVTLAITFLAAGWSMMKTAIKDYFSNG